MRIRLIVCLTLLLSIATSAHAQDNRLPPCSAAALATLADIQPAYDELLETWQSVMERNGPVTYIETYFAWRQQITAQLPLCAEMLEIALLMDYSASNNMAELVLDSALRRAGLSLSLNPYRDPIFGQTELTDRLAQRTEAAQDRRSAETSALPETQKLPACARLRIRLLLRECPGLLHRTARGGIQR